MGRKGLNMEFTGFLGNSQLKQRLSASFAAGKSSHCYLLCGPVGSGKHTLARILSAALQCPEKNPPCMICRDCRKALAGNHPDIIVIDDPEKKSVSVELIRQLQADAYIRPNEASKKVYIIPRAMELTDAAQNAFLKLMEEPPSYAVFLLLTDNAEKLLPTVRSRCAELRLEPVPADIAIGWMAEKFPDQSRDALRAVYRRSGGYLGQAAELLQKEGYAPQTKEFAQAFAKKDTMALTRVLCAMEKQPRAQLQELLEQWRQLLTDALLVREGAAASEEATAIGRSRTGTDLSNALRSIRRALDNCTANVGTGHICGWLLVQFKT